MARIVVFVLPERVTVGRLLLVTVVSTPGAVELPVLVLAWQTLRHSQRSGRQMASVALVRIPRPDRCVVGDRIPETEALLVSYRPLAPLKSGVQMVLPGPGGRYST